MLPTGGVILLVAAPALKTLLCLGLVAGEVVCAFSVRLLMSKTEKQQRGRQKPGFCIRKYNTLSINHGLRILILNNALNFNHEIFILTIIFSTSELFKFIITY